MPHLLGIAELEAFLRAEFPQVVGDFRIEALTDTGAVVRLVVADHHLRPGGTISGPSMFALADVGVYIALLSQIGAVALAVTTSSSMDFLRKPEAGRDLLAEVVMLKVGRSLAIGDVQIRSDGKSGPEAVVARATLTYAIPPKRPS